MKKWIFIIISFIISFAVLVVLTFEVAFRMLTADEVINFMGKMGFLGFGVSFDSWFIFLVLLCTLGAFAVSIVVFFKIKKVK
ncbi:hypothetical protein C7M52_00592 [Mixta theicola]|nr:hypothetical protein [Mixta theicola]QHM74656.1 hypothetical protein C7M52_00592 [Mixta theicola]